MGRSRHKSSHSSDYIFQPFLLFRLASSLFLLFVGPKRLLLKYLGHNAVDSKQAVKVEYGWGWVRRKVKENKKERRVKQVGELCRKVAKASFVILLGIVLRIRPVYIHILMNCQGVRLVLTDLQVSPVDSQLSSGLWPFNRCLHSLQSQKQSHQPQKSHFFCHHSPSINVLNQLYDALDA